MCVLQSGKTMQNVEYGRYVMSMSCPFWSNSQTHLENRKGHSALVWVNPNFGKGVGSTIRYLEPFQRRNNLSLLSLLRIQLLTNGNDIFSEWNRINIFSGWQWSWSTNKWINEWMMNAWMYGRIDEGTDEQMDKWWWFQWKFIIVEYNRYNQP